MTLKQKIQLLADLKPKTPFYTEKVNVICWLILDPAGGYYINPALLKWSKKIGLIIEKDTLTDTYTVK